MVGVSLHLPRPGPRWYLSGRPSSVMWTRTLDPLRPRLTSPPADVTVQVWGGRPSDATLKSVHPPRGARGTESKEETFSPETLRAVPNLLEDLVSFTNRSGRTAERVGPSQFTLLSPGWLTQGPGPPQTLLRRFGSPRRAGGHLVTPATTTGGPDPPAQWCLRIVAYGH